MSSRHARPLRPADETPLARFTEILADAEALAGDLAPALIPAALGRLEQLRVTLTVRVLSASGPPPDRLLPVGEAAELLGMAQDTLYRRSAEFPFTIRDGRRLRFSRRGIDSYIRSRQGRR